MIPRAEFHERQYELAANIELIGGSGEFFAPTPTAEKLLGIDCALTPGDSRIWSLLGVSPPSRRPLGAKTFPAWPKAFPTGAPPPFLVSLFVQYKRPDYLVRGSAGEWQHHGAPYYRMHLTSHQHRLLIDLEQSVGSDAVVVYAVPSFWQYDDLWMAQGLGAILDTSVFVRPSTIGPGHRRWTWNPGGRGIAHSEPFDAPPQRVSELRDEIVARRGHATPKTPRDHLAAVAEAVSRARAGKSPEQWAEDIGTRLKRSLDERRPPGVADEQLEMYSALSKHDETLQELAEAAVVAEGAARARASWLILAVQEKVAPTPN